MKILASVAFVAASLLAFPTLAGPAGTGLTFTEEVAKKNSEKRAAKAQASADCTSPKALTANEVAPSDSSARDACRVG